MSMEKRAIAFINKLEENREFFNKKIIGIGSARYAFNFGDNLVLKISNRYFERERYKEDFENPYNELLYGINQTKKEIQVWDCTDVYTRLVLAKIYFHGEINGVPFVVMEKLCTSEVECRDYYISNDDAHCMAKELKAKLPKGYMRMLDRLSDMFNLCSGDFFENSGNYGITREGRMVLCDYGFCGSADYQYDFY